MCSWSAPRPRHEVLHACIATSRVHDHAFSSCRCDCAASIHLSSCFEHACTSPVIMARLEVCVGLEFAPDAVPAARHWRPMTEMQQERAIDGSPVIYLGAPCGGPERLLGGFHAFNRTTHGLPDNMLEYRCRHGTRAVVRPAPEPNVLVLGVTVKPKAGNVICRFTFLFTGALACESSHDDAPRRGRRGDEHDRDQARAQRDQGTKGDRRPVEEHLREDQVRTCKAFEG